MRLLLDPNAAPGVPAPAAPAPAAPPPPPPAPDLARPPVGAPGGPPIPPTIPLTVDEYQRLRGVETQFREFQTAQAKALEEKEAARLKALAERGQIEEALNQQKTTWEQRHADAESRYAKLESQVAQEKLNGVLADALTGRALIGDTPEQKQATANMVRRLLHDDFEATRDASGHFVVREKVSGRPADQVLRERLDGPQFALFFASQHGGGSGTDGTRPPAITPTVEESRVKTAAHYGFPTPRRQ